MDVCILCIVYVCVVSSCHHSHIVIVHTKPIALRVKAHPLDDLRHPSTIYISISTECVHDSYHLVSAPTLQGLGIYIIVRYRV